MNMLKVIICVGYFLFALDVFAGNSKFLDVVENGELDEIKSAIESGADINALNDKGETALHLAAFMNDYEIVSYLLSKNMDHTVVDKSGKTPLHTAARNCHLETVKVLVDSKANVSTKSINGMTPKAMAEYTLKRSGMKDEHCIATVNYLKQKER